MRKFYRGWKDWSLTFKSGAIIASSLIMLLGSVITSYKLEQQTADSTAEMRRTLKVQSDIQSLHTLFAEAATGVRGFLLTDRDDFLAPYNAAVAQLPVTISALQANVRDPVQVARLGRVLSLIQQKLASLDVLRNLDGATPDDLRTQLLAGKKILDELRTQIGAMTVRESELVEQRTAAVQDALHRNLLMNLATILVGIIGASAMLMFMMRVVRRVRFAADNAERLARGMQLEPTDAAADELGQLAERLHKASLLLADRAAAAQAASQAKTEFLSRTSHELRTPLNAILGFAQLLEDDQANIRARENAAQITRAGRHLLTLINEVLDIARIEAGKFSIQVQPIQLASLLAEALNLVAPLAAQRKIHLDQLVCPDQLAVLADRQRLMQVLLNLLSNAIKYNSPNGQVRIQVAAYGDTVSVAIEDDGPGLSADLTERLFTPFDRLGAERGTSEGAGLGLAVSKSLMQAMHGDIIADSVQGKGTVFTLSLPHSVRPAQAIPVVTVGTPAVHPLEPTTTRTVLCIEPDASNRALIETLAARRPHWRLYTASTGQEGLQLARQCLPDVLLVDILLPDLSGEALLHAIGGDAVLAQIPVVILNGDKDSAAISLLNDSAIAGYLAKPLNLQQFFKLLDWIIQ
ncbi:ATP-binding protein [Collimonas pratensis]|uniref:histidine kinase n=1 Tax=Collimonas pratensis TaxID=279113 RepID=A0A127Q8L2_9BURK|nr:ATP-binding protein [Collimonas pratensis]AMP06336.1 his Kinase A domain protein [Collimonas pratensis]